MSSYADVAKHGPSQTEEEKKAATIPELEDHHAVETTPVTSDSHHINVVPSDFREQEIKTETQASQHERDAELESKKAEVKKETKKAARKAEHAIIAAGKDVRTYNIIDSVLVVALGVVGYNRYREGRLDLQTVSIGIAGLGLFAGAQGFVQRWFKKQ